MAIDLPDVHDRALQATRAVVAAVGDDMWHQPTPCDGWDVRTVVNHVVSGNWWVAELVGGRTIDEVGDRYDGDVLGDDPLGAWDASAEAACAAFREPGAMERPVAVSYGPVPGEVYAGHRLIDVLIHGWDIAKGAGGDTRLDPELVEACWEVVEPQKDMLAGSGAFGSGVSVPEDADPQTRLLAVLGREG